MLVMWQPDVTVAAICEKNGRFLMVEERAKSTQQIVFNQPAGHLEDNETIIQGVIRETLEETCRHFQPESLLGLYRMRNPQTGKTYIRYAFCGEISEVDQTAELDPDIIRTHWMSHQELQQNKQLRSDVVLQCIDDYLSGVRFPLDILKEL